jgi:hypothetical protein
LKSYIKIYGPPHLKAIRALEEIAVGLPETCIMDHAILTDVPQSLAEDIGGWFNSRGVVVPVERCESIISKSGESLGEYDFFFEWYSKPKREQIDDLIERIDEAMTKIGCMYTITTEHRS